MTYQRMNFGGAVLAFAEFVARLFAGSAAKHEAGWNGQSVVVAVVPAAQNSAYGKAW